MGEISYIGVYDESGKVKKLYEPQPKQQLLHLSTAEETLFGGAAGGGKSHGLMWDAYQVAYNLDGANLVFFRRESKDLYRSLVVRTKMTWPKSFGGFNENKNLWIINTKNGKQSYIWFCHLNTESELSNHQSIEYDGIYFDELTHFTLEMYLYMKTRLRTTKVGHKPFIKSATNPGGIGHQWVKERFLIDRTELHYKKWQPAPELNPLTGAMMTPGYRMFIPSFITDNKALMDADPQYVNRLSEQKPTIAKQLLLGDWTGFSGQAFSEFSEMNHVVSPFEIPKDWPRWRGIDYGYTQPTCCLWFTIDKDTQTIYVYREYYKSKETDKQQAKAIVFLSKYPDETAEDFTDTYSVADPSIWSERGATTASGLMHSVARVYAENGLYCKKAANARTQGFMRVHEYLGTNPLTGKPYLQIFSTCENLIRTIPLLIIDKDNQEDINTKQEDHAYDALRYFLMTKPLAPERVRQDPRYAGKTPEAIAEHKYIEKLQNSLVKSKNEMVSKLNGMGI